MESVQYVAAIILAVVAVLASSSPQAPDGIETFLQNVFSPSMADGDRYTSDGWLGPIGQQVIVVAG